MSAGGTAEILATEIDGVRLGAPNDLAFGPDGRLYFTDPGGQFDARERPDPGYVFALAPDGSGEVIAETGHSYPNGVAVERDGAVVWTESYTNAVRRWRVAEGVSEVAVTAHLPDGLAVATDGDLYVTTSDSGGIQILQPDGSPGAFVAVGVVLTNCAFAGSALFVTDGGHTGSSREPLYSGSLLSVEVAAEGMPLFQGALG